MIISAAFTTVSKVVDALWANVSLLVKDIGINGATNNSFYDDGPYKFLPARNGDVTQGSFSPFGSLSGDAPPQMGGSVYFDGTGDYLEFPSSTAFQFGTGDFTAEAWVYKIGTTAQNLFVWDVFSVYCGGSNELGLYVNSMGGVGMSGGTLTSGTWNHVALVRASGVFKFYVNGISVASYSNSSNFTGTYQALSYSSSTWNGSISNFRVVKGTAVYTANFKPPTAPLTAISGTSLLTCQSATAITDASSNAFTVSKYGDVRAVSDSPFGYGSVYFDGSGDYLSIPSSTAVAYGTGDFTVEFWAYPTSSSGSLFVSGYNGTAVAGVNVGITNSTSLWWLFGNGSGWDFERRPTYTLSMNTWHHFAVTRESGTAKLYVDGVLVDSVANTTNFGSSAWYVGASASAGYNITGNVSNLRVVKGSAVYTGSSFAVPTAPLTAITGTSLLTCQDKGSIVDASTNSFAVSRVGDARPVGMTPFAQKQAGYWSAYFDGNYDRLNLPDSTILNLGNSNYTIECWYYLTSTPATSTGIFYLSPNGTRVWWYAGTMYYTVASGPQINLGSIGNNVGQWYHLAVTRNGSTTTVYLDGVSVGSTTTTYTINDQLPSIGDNYNGSTVGFPGYISNFRIVKGSAVYASDFTPPKEPLAAVPGTILLTCQDNRFKDNSSNNFAVTKGSDATVSRFNPFGPSLPAPTVNLASAGSVYFDGSGDYLNCGTSTAYAVGTGDFTVEAWIQKNAWAGTNGYETIIDTRSANSTATGWVLGFTTAGTLYFYDNAFRINASNAISLGTWQHVAVVRNGTNLTAYVNGVSVGSTSNSSNYTDNTLWIGSNPWYPGNEIFGGTISNVRLVKGIAVYTSNFTPSSSPLTAISGTSLLTAQDAVTVTDASSNNFTVTKVGDAKAVEASPFKRVSTVYGGSGYFDGNGDYLLIPSNSAWSFGTGDYCIEMWVNPQSWPHTSYAPFIRTVGGTQGFIICNNGGNLVYHIPNVGDKLSASLPTLGAWTHLVVCRKGTTLSMFYNGVRVATASNSNDQAASNLAIGGSTDWNTYVNSYISNLRIVKGSSVYDPSALSFTPPTSPVDAVGGTSLLLNFDNAGIYDASNNADMQSVGDTKASTAVTKFSPGASTYFDGSGDYLKIALPASSPVRCGSGDYTIEMWVNPTSIASRQTLYADRVNVNGTDGMVFALGSGGKISLLAGVGSGWYIDQGDSGAGTQAVSTNTWSHVAIVKSGTAWSGYVNGIQSWTATASSAVLGQGTVGNIGYDAGSLPAFTGYIQDFRITRAARYTTTFTPPATEFPTTAG